ncbi:GNAT family N-acetyltransferase [Alcanivorax marinus]|uniref:L-ornithine N(alpha)-acyltransferase n=1 Tax=Alloalcanivorax marinus TaxID=1177169 RepID=A0A9Q3UQQ9_9GAMM|nr:GNAT family N-acetyltransferase [Alloalcanivorax marinus]MBM7333740.1 GNAT family N-acetyltransferase [Alloalcanivorax marinus]MCC4309864.1 GNAT family N-acetyltransferase [Alloalcanivorax marinus]
MLAHAAGRIKALRPPFLVRSRERDLEGGARFSAYFTRSRREILKVQRLRYRIFSEEYGASFHAPFGLDRDRFDRHCLHLVVRDNQTGELVGYTRVLPGERLTRTGGFYSAGEFHMPLVERLDGRVAEIGRTCIHPEHRGGAVITVLWARLARYMLENDVRYLIGCASVALGEGYNVAAIDRRIREAHLAPSALRVTPRCRLEPVPGDALAERGVKMPPLLKAYLRMGARVCGEPCWDPDFNCLDYFILMEVDRLPARYVQHFLQPAEAVAMV